MEDEVATRVRGALPLPMCITREDGCERLHSSCVISWVRELAQVPMLSPMLVPVAVPVAVSPVVCQMLA